MLCGSTTRFSFAAARCFCGARACRGFPALSSKRGAFAPPPGKKDATSRALRKTDLAGQKKHASGQKRVLAGGIEPTTLGLLDPRSDQLSYASDVSGRRRGRSEAPPNAPLAAHREKPRGLTLDGGENEIATGQSRNGDPHLFRWRSTLCVLDNSCATANIKSQTHSLVWFLRHRRRARTTEQRGRRTTTLGKAHARAGARKLTARSPAPAALP